MSRINDHVVARREADGRWAYWLEWPAAKEPDGVIEVKFLFHAERPGRLSDEQRAILALHNLNLSLELFRRQFGLPHTLPSRAITPVSPTLH